MSNKRARPKSTILILLLGCVMAPLCTRAADVASFSKQPDAWFTSDEGKRVLDNILTWQNKHGGWWKAYDATKPRPGAKPSKDARYPEQDQNLSGEVGTFDNKATWSELRLLARGYTLTK